MGSKYGLATAMRDVKGGYEKEQSRQAISAQNAQKAEMGDMKLQEQRGKLEKEGVADAVRLMLSGDMESAMEKYNSTGEDRMTELEFDSNDGMVSFVDSEGVQRDMMIGQLMVAAGLNPQDLDTPRAKHGREKEMVEHKAKMSKKYGISNAGRAPSVVQTAEWIKGNLKGKDGNPMTADEAWEMANAGRYSREELMAKIYGQIQKSDRHSRLSEEEIYNKVEERMRAIDALKGREDKPAPNSNKGIINRESTNKDSRPWR